MDIQTITSQPPTTVLALEAPKHSKFSKVDSLKSLDNPFKKIALAVVHIFIALRDWVCKPFSKNITGAKADEINVIKAQLIFLKQFDYVEQYAEETGELPTEKHFLEFFNDKTLKRLNKEVDDELKNLSPECKEELQVQVLNRLSQLRKLPSECVEELNTQQLHD